MRFVFQVLYSLIELMDIRVGQTVNDAAAHTITLADKTVHQHFLFRMTSQESTLYKIRHLWRHFNIKRTENPIGVSAVCFNFLNGIKKKLLKSIRHNIDRGFFFHIAFKNTA